MQILVLWPRDCNSPEAVLTDADGPVFGFVQHVYASDMPAADGARSVVAELNWLPQPPATVKIIR